MSYSVDKKNIREEYIAAREAIDPAVAKNAAEKIAQHLLKFIPPTVSIIAGYRAVRGEVDLMSACEKFSAHGQMLCLPVMDVAHAPLVFHRWLIDQPLQKGRHNIDIPPAHEPVVVPDCVIVPLVAFDKFGHRLGYGAGYYDRTIQQLRQAPSPILVIGAAYAIQQIEKLPIGAHDEKLDAVVTENGVMEFI